MASKISQVKRIVSGPPARTCMAAASAAGASFRPPSLAPASVNKMTQGIQAKVAIWPGHIRKFNARPLKAKTTPASAPPAREPVQRAARKYIPIPPRKRCNRQKNGSDHVSGSSR